MIEDKIGDNKLKAEYRLLKANDFFDENALSMFIDFSILSLFGSIVASTINYSITHFDQTNKIITLNVNPK